MKSSWKKKEPAEAEGEYRFPIPVIVAFGFSVPILVFFAFELFLTIFDISTPEERCKKHCAKENMGGVVISIFARTQSQKSGGPIKCECRGSPN